MTIRTTLTTFTVKAGMETTAEEWLDVLVKRQAECVETLDREKVHFETIFTSERDGRMRISWFDVQGAGGEHVSNSPAEIDKLHLRYWHACIDFNVPPETFEHRISFVPREVEEAMRLRDQSLLHSPPILAGSCSAASEARSNDRA
jgi:hypothetical protein